MVIGNKLDLCESGQTAVSTAASNLIKESIRGVEMSGRGAAAGAIGFSVTPVP